MRNFTESAVEDAALKAYRHVVSFLGGLYGEILA